MLFMNCWEKIVQEYIGHIKFNLVHANYVIYSICLLLLNNAAKREKFQIHILSIKCIG